MTMCRSTKLLGAGLALSALPLLFACNDSTVLQPDDLSVAAAAASRTEYVGWCNWVPDHPDAVEWTLRTTPSGVLHMYGGTNVLECDGPLEGVQYVSGAATINLRNGKGGFRGTTVWDLGDGSFDCPSHTEIEGYLPPDFEFIQKSKYTCKGSGVFDGKKMKGTFSNEQNPGVGNYYYVAEMR